MASLPILVQRRDMARPNMEAKMAPGHDLLTARIQNRVGRLKRFVAGE